MSSIQFILDNLQEGQSCKEMVMTDFPLFSQDHYDTIKSLIKDNTDLTYLATRIYFNQTSVNHIKISKEKNEFNDGKIFSGIVCDVTVITTIDRDMSVHLATCKTIEDVYNFIKPFLNFH